MQVSEDFGPGAIALPDASTPDISAGLVDAPVAPNAYGNGNAVESDSPDGAAIKSEDGARVKPKQKRNKPTLSCLECVGM